MCILAVYYLHDFGYVSQWWHLFRQDGLWRQQRDQSSSDRLRTLTAVRVSQYTLVASVGCFAYIVTDFVSIYSLALLRSAKLSKRSNSVCSNWPISEERLSIYSSIVF